jgi:hypothetical protein
MNNSFSCLIEYLKHAKCYHKYQNEYKFCAEQYYSNYEKIKDNVNEDQETQIKNWCWYVITRLVYAFNLPLDLALFFNKSNPQIFNINE